MASLVGASIRFARSVQNRFARSVQIWLRQVGASSRFAGSVQGALRRGDARTLRLLCKGRFARSVRLLRRPRQWACTGCGRRRFRLKMPTPLASGRILAPRAATRSRPVLDVMRGASAISPVAAAPTESTRESPHEVNSDGRLVDEGIRLYGHKGGPARRRCFGVLIAGGHRCSRTSGIDRSNGAGKRSAIRSRVCQTDGRYQLKRGAI
jgi:hypothetical protein